MRYGPALGFIALIAVFIGIAAYSSSRHPADMNTVPVAEREDPNAPPKTDPKTADKSPKAVDKTPVAPASPGDPKREAAFDKVKQGAVHVTMNIEGKGAIELELYPKAAPKTVAHFVGLCRQHFYDGTLFHRVVAGFVAQGGDPESKKVDAAAIRDLTPEQAGQQFGLGKGGSGTTVPLEANLPHTVYSLGQARSQDPNSGDSQFYINLSDNASLDGQYCVFGRVIKGKDVAANLHMGDKITSMTVGG